MHHAMRHIRFFPRHRWSARNQKDILVREEAGLDERVMRIEDRCPAAHDSRLGVDRKGVAVIFRRKPRNRSAPGAIGALGHRNRVFLPLKMQVHSLRTRHRQLKDRRPIRLQFGILRWRSHQRNGRGSLGYRGRLLRMERSKVTSAEQHSAHHSSTKDNPQPDAVPRLHLNLLKVEPSRDCTASCSSDATSHCSDRNDGAARPKESFSAPVLESNQQAKARMQNPLRLAAVPLALALACSAIGCTIYGEKKPPTLASTTSAEQYERILWQMVQKQQWNKISPLFSTTLVWNVDGKSLGSGPGRALAAIAEPQRRSRSPMPRSSPTAPT